VKYVRWGRCPNCGELDDLFFEDGSFFRMEVCGNCLYEAEEDFFGGPV
jgi:hypothetical protein